ncbi:hypothetical protein [Bradyrhizobium cajani]|uniref:Uncharacterized protein n=1 Tax=Bradyrhizobium cajani TaxID=1928661 RepID=A0A844SXA6_9BRAD|nr:hypothetical protein [Bradyrhizobium cajani]MCP3371005.1 hypothetical protein [Bradyrhizobium cajani]MVT71588.1 hypothetical protein [Bradyrhizobium cajani]
MPGPRPPPSAATAPAADGGGKLTMPTSTDTSFAPFVPRSTPKNGVSDGP